MKLETRIILLFIVSVLSGCSAAGVFYSKDPTRKLQQAYALEAQGRPIPAERLAKESLAIYKEKKDIFGQSEAHAFLGSFYKSKSSWKNTNTDKYLSKALEHFNLSTNRFLSLGENIQASKAYFGLGQTQGLLQRVDLACKNFHKSLSLIESGKGKDKEFIILNPEYGTAADIYKSNIEAHCK